MADAIITRRGTTLTGGGDQPQLNAPSIVKTGGYIIMQNPTTNGNFFSKFKLFINGVQRLEQAGDTVDLSTVINDYGTYSIMAKCAGTNFKDSAESNMVEYIYAEPLGIQYYGTAESLSEARSRLAATTVGNYALFSGGTTNTSKYSTVDAYDASLTRTIPTALSAARSQLAATTVGNYALFGGGYASDYCATVDVYTEA